jgi:hypothetical protein
VYVAGTRNDLDAAAVLPLSIAVFCQDCEVISSSRSDQCAACRRRFLVSLARMLGGKQPPQVFRDERWLKGLR